MKSFWLTFLIAVSLIFFSLAASAAAPEINIPNFEIDPDDDEIVLNSFIDLWDYASDAEDSDSELTFRLLDESNPDLISCRILPEDDRFVDCFLTDVDREGASVIDIEVEDTDGETDVDTFAIEIGSITAVPPLCRDIDISVGTVFIEENSEEVITAFVNNLSNKEFEIEDVRIRESSRYIRIDDVEWLDDFIDEDEDTEIEFTIEAFNVSSNKEAHAVVEIEGEFENGVDCDFGDIKETFRIFIEEDFDDFSSGICSDIIIEDDEIVLDEDDLETVEITVRNENRRDFEIDFVSVSESSPDFKVSVSRRPFEIEGGDEEVIRLRFDTDRVSRDETDKITLKISGQFSNGKRCSSSTIREQIDVTVENTGVSRADDIEIKFSPSSLQLNPGQSRTVSAIIENNSRNRKCVELDFALSSSNFSFDLEKDDFCISSKDEKEVDLTIRAHSSASPGNYTGRLEVEFGSKKESKNLAIKVLGVTPPVPSGELEVINYPASISLVPDDIEHFSLTISNSSGEQVTNLAVTMENLPPGVFFQPFFKSKLDKGEIITVNSTIETTNTQKAQFDAILKVSSDSGTIVRPVKITLAGTSEKEEMGQEAISGLVPLAGTIGIGIALLAILVVIVIVIILLVRR